MNWNHPVEIPTQFVLETAARRSFVTRGDVLTQIFFFLFLEHGVGSRQGAQVSCRLLLILYFDFTSETCCVAEGESSWLRFLKYGGSLEECQPRTHASTLKIKVPQFVLILKFWIMTRNHLMAELSLNHKTCPSHFELLNSRMPFVHNDK